MNIISVERERLYRALAAVGVNAELALHFSTACSYDIVSKFLHIAHNFNQAIDRDYNEEIIETAGSIYDSSVNVLYLHHKDKYLNLAS